MMRTYLVGMLCGVILAATFTYLFALPANDYHWQMEIWKRGGAVWTYDMKTGRPTGWKWMVEPIPDTPRQKPATVPAQRVNVRAEQL